MTRIALLFASPDTGNMGVTALGYSVIGGLARRIPDLKLSVADNGFGLRPSSLLVDGQPFEFTRCGIRLSRKFYLPESIWNLRLASRFGGGWNAIAKHFLGMDFAIDISGGDSFTDLYGQNRFQSIVQVKAYFLEQKIPLGLLPQTYGPYQTPTSRAIAVDLIRRSRFAWARDERSFKVLRDLLAESYDPSRHRCGVDVAFLLDVVKPPAGSIDAKTMNWLENSDKPTIGLNVSGLIYNDPEAAVKQYQFVADYRQVITRFVERILNESDANVLLISHVNAPLGVVESDAAACQDVARQLGEKAQGRLAVMPELSDPRHVKWVISQCDWFCGTRMHATIAGLSTGVPTAAIAYSLKTAGVFETCGQGDHVADPRELSTDQVIDRLWHSWESHQETRHSLAAGLPRVLDQANQQMDAIASMCQGAQATLPVGAVSK